MKKIQIKIFFIILAVLLLGFIVSISALNSNKLASSPTEQESKYDQFATCLTEKGAVFYGAYWCSYCNKNKELFGSAEKLLPYVECSTSDGKNQLPVCQEQKITAYPTWRFADGSEILGLVSLEVLSQKTSCPLPL
jgi:hypothetical protein